MTWTTVTKYTRTNTGVAWYAAAGPRSDENELTPMSDSDVTYVKNNYIDNGKRISASVVVSGEGLVQCKTFVYKDEASYEEYRTDSRTVAYRNAMETYHAANSITQTSRTSSAT